MAIAVLLVEAEDVLYQCSACLTGKPEGSFSPDRRGLDGSVVKWDSVCRSCRRLKSAKRSGGAVTKAKAYREPSSPALPAAPFREWLRALLIREGAWDPIADRAFSVAENRGRTIRALSLDWGVSDKRIRDVMAGLPTVSFTMVDKVLTRSGDTGYLDLLYPEIDEFLGVAA